MTDYKKLLDVFEMAEVLTDDSYNQLTITVFDVNGDSPVDVVFKFNEEEELETVERDYNNY